MKLLGMSGSLREASSNTRLLEAAALLAPASVAVEIVTVLGDLPHFNPDLPVESHETLSRYIDSVRTCDGILVSCPVYAGGYPGTFKNALDWLVGTDAFVEKPFAFLSTSNRVPAVQTSLAVVLQTMGGIHVAGATCLVPLLGTDLTLREILGNTGFTATIEGALNAYTDYLRHRARH
ncbi:MAG: NAD(P)H-dependent oxidoreductase [Pseudomonadales bacterium]|nr:NAD(P)H-dependent oxidoreductase [Pseudomonadales bacterium]MCP5182486.1 NAD(P)H-dependent oxidoreductase [Pseudomonadales bacterium]